MKRLALLLLLCSCVSAGGMLKVEAESWRSGGIAHLSRSRPFPAMPTTTAPAPDQQRWLDWRHALDIAAQTCCSQDEQAKLKGTQACACAASGLDAAGCDLFLAEGGP